MLTLTLTPNPNPLTLAAPTTSPTIDPTPFPSTVPPPRVDRYPNCRSNYRATAAPTPTPMLMPTTVRFRKSNVNPDRTLTRERCAGNTGWLWGRLWFVGCTWWAWYWLTELLNIDDSSRSQRIFVQIVMPKITAEGERGQGVRVALVPRTEGREDGRR